MKSIDTKLVSNQSREEANSNSERVAAGKANWAKRRGFTPAGCERLREAALRNKPWLNSRWPRTKAGKAKVATNGKKRQLGLFSLRELRVELAEIRALAKAMSVAQEGAAGIVGG
jgi:hypothetical protein